MSALAVVLVTAFAWRAGTGRRWPRLFGLAVLALLSLWAVVSWAGLTVPPAGSEGFVFVAAAMALWPASTAAVSRLRSRRGQK